MTKRCNHCLYVVFTKTADDLDHESINILQNTNHEVCAYILSFIREEQYGSNLPILQKNKQRVVVVLEVLGGNDISPISDPEVTFNNIRDLVEKLEETDVRRVYISDILPRGDFSKSKPRGLTKAKFDSDRKAINKLLFKEYGTRVIKFHDIRYPRDYHSDKVHLSEPTQDSKKCGLRKYFFRIRLTFCSSRD